MSELPSEPTPDVDTGDTPDRLAIGVIIAPHGVQGEVRMLIWSHFPEHIPRIKRVYLDEEPDSRRLRSARLNGPNAVLRIEGVESRDQAEALRGTVIRIGFDQAAPLEEGEYYQFQLMGLRVVTEAGEPLGQVVDIIETGANDVYVVRDSAGQEHLFPALKSVVIEVDLAAHRMVVRPLEYYEG